jgi:hypothetical protein
MNSFLKRIKNINSGKIWIIPIDKFLANTDFTQFDTQLKQRGINTIHELFQIFKRNEVKKTINELDIPENLKESFHLYVNNEMEFIDKFHKFSKILIISLIGVITLIFPFISASNQNEFNIDILQTYFFTPIYILKGTLALVYFILIYISIKSIKNLNLISILIIVIGSITILEVLYIIRIYQLSFIMEKVKTTVKPSIGYLIGIITNIVLWNKILETKKLIKFEKPTNNNLDY